MPRYFKMLPSKSSYEYTKRQKIVIYSTGILLFVCFVIGGFYKSAEENDAIVNGKSINVKLSDITYGSNRQFYFYYRGEAEGVRYYQNEDIKYHLKDSIPVLYSEKYDYFILQRPAKTNLSTVPQMTTLLATVLLVCLLFWVYKKFSKVKY